MLQSLRREASLSLHLTGLDTNHRLTALFTFGDMHIFFAAKTYSIMMAKYINPVTTENVQLCDTDPVKTSSQEPKEQLPFRNGAT